MGTIIRSQGLEGDTKEKLVKRIEFPVTAKNNRITPRNNEKGYLTDTCLTAQDKYKADLDYFRIEY